jgi:LuxR family maltose regulon positive regulatory protein
MQMASQLIRTKIHLPFIRPNLVHRPRLQEVITQGLQCPLTLIIAPAGFGKTTLVASCIDCCGMPVAWLSLDRDDNQTERFLRYLITALQEADPTIGSEVALLPAVSQQTPPETILTSLINDLDSIGRKMVLVLDDYQFINNQAVHEQVTFLLEHCPNTFHVVIAARSDPPLPLTRLRARGQTIELRAADLRFTEPEASQFLNDAMGLRLDAGSIGVLEERTEGWIAGLQMAALSMRDREDVREFIEGFSGTNRYILDYLLEEVLASQSPEIQHFLLYTSILERLTAPLCDALLANNEGSENRADGPSTRSESLFLRGSASILEYLERANLFLVPLDDKRIWYRYHHLFADLLRAQLRRSLSVQGVAQLHIQSSEWLAQNGSILEAINHASLAQDDERVERLIEQNYMEIVNRGEMSWLRFWTGKLSKELLYSRPWLCIYEAQSRAWFGELDEAHRLLEEAEKRIHVLTSEGQTMLGHLAYVKSRVTAMRGDNKRAIELCLAVLKLIPASNLGLQLDIRMTLGYEYFLSGDYRNAEAILQETIQTCGTIGSIINMAAAYCVMARLHAVRGTLKKSYELYQTAAQMIPQASGHHLGAKAIVDVGIADLLYEWNEIDQALVHVRQGLDLMLWWGKTDDFVLADITLARIHLAQANKSDAVEAVEKAIRLIQTRGVFSEAREVVEIAQVKLWLAQGDLQAAYRWAVTLEKRFGFPDPFRFEDELTHITQARVLIAQNKPDEAIDLLSHLEKFARSSGRIGRVIEILFLKAFALQETGDSEQAIQLLTECLAFAEPEGYVRLFLDEGQPMRLLLAQWLAHSIPGPLREYAIHLLAQFNAETHVVTATQEKVFSAGDPSASLEHALVEPLSQRELEVLHFIALGRTNQEIAGQLIVSKGTIKAHTASIYRKLDVANRTEAVARARQLGILP